MENLDKKQQSELIHQSAKRVFTDQGIQEDT